MRRGRFYSPSLQKLASSKHQTPRREICLGRCAHDLAEVCHEPASQHASKCGKFFDGPRTRRRVMHSDDRTMKRRVRESGKKSGPRRPEFDCNPQHDEDNDLAQPVERYGSAAGALRCLGDETCCEGAQHRSFLQQDGEPFRHRVDERIDRTTEKSTEAASRTEPNLSTLAVQSLGRGRRKRPNRDVYQQRARSDLSGESAKR